MAKKIKRYLFVCMMLLLTTALQVKAADMSGWCGNGVRWELTGDVLNISGEGTMYSYTNDIPPWGERREFITSVVIGHGVKNIGEYAFDAHSKIKSIEIPDSVTSIGWHAFSGCDSLTSVEIPEGVTSIESGTFYGCGKLESIIIPDSVTKIGGYAFFNCGSLKYIEIPENVLSIGNYAFRGCYSLTKIEIPPRVKKIEGYTFYLCGSLKSIEIPARVTSIGSTAFQRCSSLKCVIFLGDAPEVGNGAFSWTNKSVVGYYPANNSTWTNIVTSSEFGGGKFMWKTPCSGEHKFIQVVKEDYTCEDCKLGGTYEEVVNCTQCDMEMSRIIKKNPPKEHNWDNGTVTREVTAKLDGKKIYKCSDCTQTREEDIPKFYANYIVTTTGTAKKRGTVAYTGGWAETQKVVNIPATIVIDGITYDVTGIAENAFRNDETITKVTMASSVTKIGKYAFSGCKKLKSVTISNNIKTIEDEAFYKCTALTKITIPKKVNKIGKSAFEGCKKLKTITIKTTKLTSKNVGENAFKGIYKKATCKVPKSKLKAYKSLLKKKGMGTKVKIKK